ncbi:hypothetical protein BGZ60DRAFT_400152 [Tricladium varicosporioides]|nr:hypothetical protein BGZ60DRAFT_400152 [Hymenoscyphus varicosporioides]
MIRNFVTMQRTPSKRPNPRQTSCNECQKRKQKCKPGIVQNGACYSCGRRWPPVECVKRSTNTEEIPLGDRQPEQPNASRAIPALQFPQHGRNGKGITRPPNGAVPIGMNNQVYNPQEVGRITVLNTPNTTSIPSTLQNSELFHFVHSYVVPILCSLDGRGVPNKILPWMLQYPLMPKIALLTSAGAKAQLEWRDPSRCPQSLAMRRDVLVLVNELLKRDWGVVYVEAICAVMHLVHLEWYWGEYESMWAHMKGIKEMLRLQGGIGKIKDELLMQMLVLTDYELACSFNRDLLLQRPQTYERRAQPLPVPYPESLNNPLLDFSTPFVDIRET